MLSEDGDDERPLLEGSSNSKFIRLNRRRLFLILAAVAGFLSILSIAFGAFLFHIRPDPWLNGMAKGILESAFEDGLMKCEILTHAGKEKYPKHRSRNPRWQVDINTPKPNKILIKHATIWDGDGNEYNNTDILLVDGLIADVGINIQSKNAMIVDAGGRIVTPGIVDMHSHMGVDSWPETRGTDDTNEGTNPLTPMLKSLDGFNVEDIAIQIINSGGITTSLILPGSANLMGGEAFAVKLRVPKSNSAHDMLINFGMNSTEGKQWRWMKMACGENIKNFYGRRLKIMPDSRLGEGWLFRKQFQTAKKYNEAQDDWCMRAKHASKKYGKNAHFYFDERFPEDDMHDSLGALLRGDVLLQNHCYEPVDMEMQIRNSKEFGFKITAFHHAVEAWMIADVLAREKIAVAMFADLWAYKKEAYEPSVKSGKILSDAGVKVAYKSDHPVLNAQHLVHEAAKAHHYGLNAKLAIASVTSVPADLIGQGWRIGRIRKSYDADVVIWNRSPLELGATPLKVFVDGVETFSLPFTSVPEKLEQPVPPIPSTIINQIKKLDSYTVTNIGKLFADENTLITDAKVVVQDGFIKCFGSSEKCISAGNEFDLNGGYVVPGAVVGDSQLGLVEIEAEKVTHDGESNGYSPESGGFRAADGLRVSNESKVLASVHRAGVTAAFAIPAGSGVVKGQSTLFYTGAKDYSDALAKEVGHLKVSLGSMAKDGKGQESSVSGQIALLRKLLFDHIPTFNDTESESPFSDVIRGDLTLAVDVIESDDILKLLLLKKSVEKKLQHQYGKSIKPLRITVVGGAEAWVVANELADAKVPVHLRPGRCVPSDWERKKCRVPSSLQPSAIEILTKAGVSVSISAEADSGNRNLFWEAGWALADTQRSNSLIQITESQAIGFVTWNTVDSFIGRVESVKLGIGRIVSGTRANFVGFNGTPLEFGVSSQLVVTGNSMLVRPEQD